MRHVVIQIAARGSTGNGTFTAPMPALQAVSFSRSRTRTCPRSVTTSGRPYAPVLYKSWTGGPGAPYRVRTHTVCAASTWSARRFALRARPAPRRELWR